MHLAVAQEVWSSNHSLYLCLSTFLIKSHFCRFSYLFIHHELTFLKIFSLKIVQNTLIKRMSRVHKHAFWSEESYQNSVHQAQFFSCPPNKISPCRLRNFWFYMLVKNFWVSTRPNSQFSGWFVLFCIVPFLLFCVCNM